LGNWRRSLEGNDLVRGYFLTRLIKVKLLNNKIVEYIDVVDRNDEFVKTIDRANHMDDEIVRVTGFFILNKEDKVLLQLRSVNKKSYPNRWDCTGGGHVESGEDYLVSAQRELFEEAGIETELKFLDKVFFELDDGRKHFNAYFIGTFDGDIKIDLNEVSQVRAFSKQELREMVKDESKFHPECVYGLKKYVLDVTQR
jgi:isopentenyldiphosphate isomerase